MTANKLDSTTGSVTWGTDRTVSVETLPATRGSSPAYHVWRTITKVWKDGDTSSSGGTVVSTEDRSTDGLRTWTSRLGVANEQTATVSLAGGGDWTVESVASDGSKTFVTYLDGLWDKTEAKNSGDSVIASTSARDASNSRGYDTLNRPTHRKDSRTGVTETGYRSAISNVIVSTIPPAGSGQATAYAYDHRGRRTTVDAPQSDDAASNELNNITVTAHWASGLVKQVSGDQAYPVTYTYDYAGRMQTMTTSSAAGDAVTKWLYSEASGLLGGKLYNFTDDATVNEYGPTYTYTAAGRLQTRSWVREVSAGVKLKSTYGYTHGLLTSIDYNDSTPDVAYNYDAFSGNNDHMPGTLETATRDGATWTYKYNGTTLRLESETHPVGGTSVERVLTRSYDTHGRSDGFDLGTSGDVDEDFSVVYGFDTAGRLDEVAAAGRTFTYGYTTNSYGLVGTVDGPNDILVTNTWDPNRDVLAVKKNELASDTVSQFTYSVNDLGQRTGVATTGGAFQSTSPGWAWGYDALGQVTEAVHGGLPATLNRSYLYDSIGNRLSVTDGIGTTSDTLDYIPNGLNQYAVIDPGSHYPLYDLDGNLQEDAGINAMGYGLKFEWDAENRMTVARKADNTLLATYKYDHRGRRIRKTTTAAASGGAKDIGYLYDGWNVVTEYEIDSGPAIAPYRAYTWGLDLSGSLQGAGGVGGLLCVHGGADTDGSGNRVWQDGYYPTYDGNGNISEYITDDGYESAPHFEYDASGRIITSSGLGLADFAYRFSTKPMDFETGLCYYGYRYYDQTTGRWLSKDPLGEKGGINLYGFVSNRSLARIDGLGLQGFEGQPAADNPLFDDLDPNRPKEGEEGYVKPKEEGPSLLPNNNTLPDPPAPPQPPNIKNYSTGHYICRRKNQGYRGDESGENCINGHCEYDCTLDGQRPKQGDAPDFAKIEFEFRHCFDCPPTQNQWGYNDFRSLDSICPNVIELKLELFEHEHMGDVFNAPEVPENKPPRNWNL